MQKRIHIPFEILILILVLVSHAFVAFAPQGSLLNWYRTDDAFYYFKVAQNISEGRGITFDGFSPTNGFHPLWMLICIPVFYFSRFDLFTPLRILVMLLALLNAATGILLYRLFAANLSRQTGWLVSFFWMFYSAIHGLTTMLGMETGVNAFSIILLFYIVSRVPGDANQAGKHRFNMIWLGLVALLVLFSRLDNIFLVLMAGIWLVFRFTSLRWRLLMDFCMILLIALVSYYARIQSTTNIFNFLPFAYLLIGLSLVCKPLAIYFSGAYEEKKKPDRNYSFWKPYLYMAGASLVILAVILLIYEVLHLARGYSRAVLLTDMVLSVILLPTTHFFISYFQSRKKVTAIEDISLKRNWKNWLARAVQFLLPLGSGLGAYMLFNKSYAGTALPISGTIKRWWGLLPNTVYGTPARKLDGVVQGFFSPSPNAGPWSLLIQPLDSLAQTLAQLFNPLSRTDLKTIFLYALLFIFAGISFWLIKRQSAWVVKTADRIGLLPLFAGCLFSILFYKATGYLHAKYWYWISEMILLVLSGGILVECIFCEIRQKMKGKDPTILISKAASALIFFVFIMNVWQLSRWDMGNASQHPYLTETQQIEQNTPSGSVIGMTGGGVTAYFIHDRTIVNLDGLINGLEYYQQLQKGNADAYFKSINMQYVIGAPSMLLDSDPYRWIFEGRLTPLIQLGEQTIYSYHPLLS